MSRIAIDLDGVIWRGAEVIPGSVSAVNALVQGGHEVIFCTNHAQSPQAKLAVLDSFGIQGIEVVTAAQAAAARCTQNQKVLVLGDESLTEVFSQHGITAINVRDLPADGPVPVVDIVVVGAYSEWDRSRIALAADAIRAGATFLATNDDTTFPSSGLNGSRILLGNGALVAAITAATGVVAEVAGKPHAAMANILIEQFGGIDIVIGDRPETDGGLAVRLEAEFALVLSGVTRASDLPVSPEPTYVAEDLAGIVELLLPERSGLPE
ncbi:MAG: HAD-IIA family hydrolase [Microthrixaceae bacterium]